MSNRLADENSPAVATLHDLATLADYSLMDTLNCDPDGQENGVDHAPRQVITGHPQEQLCERSYGWKQLLKPLW